MASYKVCSARFFKAVVGEFLATLIFVLLGLSSTKWMAEEEEPQSYRLLLISLCFALSISIMVFCFGRVSGAHINPAVTVSMVVNKKITISKAFFYLVAQCLGATAGAAILCVITPSSPGGAVGVTMLSSNITLIQGILVELLITFQLVFTVFNTCDMKHSDLKGTAALAIGFAVFIGHLLAVPYTGASMNPARSLGPAMIAWEWEDHWVYWVGPICGGVIAAFLYKYLRHNNQELKQCAVEDFIPDTLEREEDEFFNIFDPNPTERRQWLELAEVHHLSAVIAEKSISVAPEHVCIDTEGEEQNDCPRFELQLNF